MDVDTAVVVPMNLMPLTDDTDFKSVETGLVYNSAGIKVYWNFVTTAGVMSTVEIHPTTSGDHDISEPTADMGFYAIEIPASGGNHASNDTEGVGWITGVATGILPWRGPTIGFRAAALNNSLIDGTTIDVNATAISGDTAAADNCEAMFDGTGYAGGTIKLGVDTVAISGDSTAADNEEKFFDGTGYAGTNNVIPTVTTVTNAVVLPTGTGAGQISLTSGAVILTSAYDAAKTAAPASSALDKTTWTDAKAGYLDVAVSSRLAPTVAARTLDVSATGEAGVDWANVGTPGSTVALSATTIAKSPATLAPADVSGNLPSDLKAVTAGVDFSATMKTSITTAATAATPTAAAVTAPVALTSGERNSVADAILARAIAAESYAADGGTPTLSQILWMIWAGLVDYSISGTTLTVNRQNGTPAMTFELDDATAPTSRTRAS